MVAICSEGIGAHSFFDKVGYFGSLGFTVTHSRPLGKPESAPAGDIVPAGDVREVIYPGLPLRCGNPQ